MRKSFVTWTLTLAMLANTLVSALPVYAAEAADPAVLADTAPDEAAVADTADEAYDAADAVQYADDAAADRDEAAEDVTEEAEVSDEDLHVYGVTNEDTGTVDEDPLEIIGRLPDVKKVYIGPGILSEGVNTFEAKQVWYGGYLWYVVGYADKGLSLDRQTLNLFRITGTTQEEENFETVFNTVKSNHYGGSSLKTKIESFLDGFNAAEKSAIKHRTLYTGTARNTPPYCDGIADDGPIQNVMLWPISVKEATRLDDKIVSPGRYKRYWLRSPGMQDNSVAYVEEDGEIMIDGDKSISDRKRIARPAFSVKLSDVVLVKYIEEQRGRADFPYYRPVLLDDKISVGIQSGKKVRIEPSTSGATLTIPYEITGEDKNLPDSLAVIITESGDPRYYGELNVEGDFTSTGTGTIKLPVGIDEQDLFTSLDISICAIKKNAKESCDFSGSLYRVKVSEATIKADPVVTFDTERFFDVVGNLYETGHCTNTPAPQSVKNGSVATRPENDPVWSDVRWEFKGWYDNAKCIGQEYDFTTPVTEDRTIYAGWERGPVQVAFNDNAGADAKIVKYVTVPYSGRLKYADAPTLTREGYRFDGWYSDKACTSAYDFSSAVVQNMTLYAKWIKYLAVTFNVRNKSRTINDVLAGSYIYALSMYEVTSQDPYEDVSGNLYNLKQWNYRTSATGSETLHVSPGERLYVTEDLMLYGDLEKAQYLQMTFFDEDTKVGETTFLKGTVPDRLTPEPTKDGYVFMGWYTSKRGADNLNRTCLYRFDTPEPVGRTLYAGWKRNSNFTVSIDSIPAGLTAELDKNEATYEDPVTVTITQTKPFYVPGIRPDNQGQDTLAIGGIPTWKEDAQTKYQTKYAYVSELTVQPVPAGALKKWTFTFNLLGNGQQQKDIKLNFYSHFEEDKHTHTFEYHPYEEPTCTEPGHQGWCVCTDCGMKFWLTPEWSEPKTEAQLHDDQINDNIIPDEVNIETWAYIPPTHHHYYPLGNSAVEHIAAKAPTCKSVGYVDCYHCRNCDKYFEDADCTREIDGVIPIDPDAHTFDSTTIPSQYTYSEDYTKLYGRKSCDQGCGAALVEAVSVNCIHYDPPTCTVSGSATYSHDPFTDPHFERQPDKSLVLAPLGHNWKDITYEWVSDYRYLDAHAVCSRCGQETYVHKETVCTGEGGHKLYTATFGKAPFTTRTKRVAKLSFDLGTVSADAIDDQIIEDGKKAVRPEDPTAEGYNFGGWYTDPYFDPDSAFDFSAGVVDDTVLYGKWIPIKYYNVSFVLNGHGTDIAPIRVEEGQKIFKPADPAEEDYRFFGWYTDEGLTIPYSFATPVYADTTLYAKWIGTGKPTVTVSFVMGGYGKRIPAQVIISGNKAAQPSDPIDEEMSFGGWYTADTFEESFDFRKPVLADTSVYAKWDEKDPDGFFAYFDIKEDTLTYNAGSRRYEHTYTGSKVTPRVIVEDFGGRRLKQGTDYILKYKGNLNVDKKGRPASVTITGKGNYKGSKKLLFYMMPKSIGAGADDTPADGVYLADVTVRAGTKATPSIYYNNIKLTAKDYKLTSATGSLKISAADEDSNLKLTITGKGNYTGCIKDAQIVRYVGKATMADRTLKVSLDKNTSFVYNGRLQTLSSDQLVVKNSNGDVMIKGLDYVTSYTNNRNAGTAKVTVVARNGYAGSVTKSFRIKPDVTRSVTTVSSDASVIFEKGANTPVIKVTAKAEGAPLVTLKQGTDYKVSFKNNGAVSTVRKPGKYTVTYLGNYKGRRPVTGIFTVDKASFTGKQVRLKAADMIYGKPGKYLSKLYVSYNGALLTSKDYTATYSAGGKDITKVKKYTLSGDSINVTVTLRGKGNYEGTEIVFPDCYTIKKPVAGAIDLSKVKVTKKDNVKKGIPAQSYTGNPVYPEFDIWVKDGRQWKKAAEAGLTAGTDYEVTYLNNTARGKGTILVSALPGSLKAVKSKAATFKIGQRTFLTLIQLFRN